MSQATSSAETENYHADKSDISHTLWSMDHSQKLTGREKY